MACFTQRNFFTSGAGALFKKKSFHCDVLKRELFTELTPTADDIWFWAMAVLNGTKILIPPDAQKDLIYVDIDAQLNGETLHSKNIGAGQNDVQLKRIIERYPALAEKLIREDVESKPFISVVLLIKNPADIPAHMENIFWQSFPDFELIVVNAGARIELPTMPTNFRVIDYPGGSLGDALNLGLQKAAGDYVLFKDESSLLTRTALETVAQAAAQSTADVIHFARHVRIADNEIILDDAPELKTETPQFLDLSQQIRAALWLQDKIGKRLDTKIFRRDFLLERKIKFGDDLSDFMFSALVSAEKYLLVPQVIIGA